MHVDQTGGGHVRSAASDHNTTLDTNRLPTLDRESIRVYEWIVKRGELHPRDLEVLSNTLHLSLGSCRRAISQLTQLRLLDTGCPGQTALIPLAPDTAAAALLGPLEAELRLDANLLARRRDDATKLRSTMAGLASSYFRAHRERTSATMEIISEPTSIRALLAQVALTHDRDILTYHPRPGRYRELLPGGLEEDLLLLDRGLRLRSLCQHSAQFDLATQTYAEKLSAAGSEVRATPLLPGPMIVVDREVALLPHHHGHGVVVVWEKSTVAYLSDSFHELWQSARPYRTGPVAAHETAEELKRSILIMLANGLKDDVVAKRVGVSVRACRSHIAELMRRLGARSRFQAGALAVRSGLLPSGTDGRDGLPEKPHDPQPPGGPGG
jgi:DNA-binding CsgD family transcriptional regulator